MASGSAVEVVAEGGKSCHLELGAEGHSALGEGNAAVAAGKGQAGWEGYGLEGEFGVVSEMTSGVMLVVYLVSLLEYPFQLCLKKLVC